MDTKNRNASQNTDVFQRLIEEVKGIATKKYSKPTFRKQLEKINALQKEISSRNCLESLNVFISEDTYEIRQSLWAVPQNRVQVSDRFDIRPLVEIFNNSKEYLILVLSLSCAKILQVTDDKLIKEITNGDFPVYKKAAELSGKTGAIKEYLSLIDKATIRAYNATGLNCVVAATGDLYSQLMEVAIFKSIYAGSVSIHHSSDADNDIIAKAWKMLLTADGKQREAVISEMKLCLEQGRALQDPIAILKAVKEDRGKLLIINNQVKHSDKGQDMISEIVWEIIYRKGQVVFAGTEAMESLGDMVLKLKDGNPVNEAAL